MNRASGGDAERDDTLLVTFTDNADDMTLLVNMFQVESAQFSDADTGGIQQFEHSVVPQSDRITLLSMRLGRAQRRRCLIDAQDRRKSPVFLRRRQTRTDVGRQQILVV